MLEKKINKTKVIHLFIGFNVFESLVAVCDVDIDPNDNVLIGNVEVVGKINATSICAFFQYKKFFIPSNTYRLFVSFCFEYLSSLIKVPKNYNKKILYLQIKNYLLEYAFLQSPVQ